MSEGIFVLTQAPDARSEPLLAAPPPHLQDANVHSAADISSILLSSNLFRHVFRSLFGRRTGSGHVSPFACKWLG